MYDPIYGRWLTEDPSGFAAGDVNLYRYVGNSPTNATDPSGLQRTVFTPPGTGDKGGPEGKDKGPYSYVVDPLTGKLKKSYLNIGSDAPSENFFEEWQKQEARFKDPAERLKYELDREALRATEQRSWRRLDRGRGFDLPSEFAKTRAVSRLVAK